jgi:hypothetical protein
MILPNITTPYVYYIKIAAVALVASALIGTGLYVRHVFADRARLQTENGALTTKLTAEQEKYISLMKQTNQIAEMNQKIIEAVKHVKINSSIYIDKVEAAKLVPPAAGGTVLVTGGMPKALSGNTALPIFDNNSANRTAAGAS